MDNLKTNQTEITENADITKLTTLRVVAHAEKFATPSSVEDIITLFREIKTNNWRWNILGAGSNTLLSSRALEGILVSTNNLDFVKQIDETSYEVGSGLRMPRFCALMTKESLSGTEFMEGIPGSIGGGIIMNAGAHGAEISDILVSAKLLNLETLELEDWTKDRLGLGYRHSNINPQKHLIISGTFKLKPDEKEAIRARVVHNNHARTSKQPIKAWTCGCTFQNPLSNYGAGQLIDELGLKGHRVGDFMVSNLHGNFFENVGQGSSLEFCELMRYVQKQALEKKNINQK
jgi:UDP-N-acetylmuramate dehydrogenase